MSCAKREQAINVSCEALSLPAVSLSNPSNGAKKEANLPARHSAQRDGGRGLGYGG